MINLATEQVVSLGEATKRLPRRRAGKGVHLATMYRWAMRGCRGVKLETLRVGGTLCTSLEALQRFCERCSDPSAAAPTTTSKSRKREIASAERELTEAGI
jgi:hypothetical protein